METFRGLKLAYEAAEAGGNVPTAFNAANEYAVARFLKDEIGFFDIPAMIDEAMQACTFIADPSVDEILETEAKTYELLRAKHE